MRMPDCPSSGSAHDWREAPNGEMVCRRCPAVADEYADAADPPRINEQLYAWLERRAIREQM